MAKILSRVNGVIIIGANFVFSASLTKKVTGINASAVTELWDALRAGYNYKTSPYKNFASSYNASAHYGSVGFGIRTKYVFFDLAYVLKYSKDSFWLYPDNTVSGEYEDLIHNLNSDLYAGAISTKGLSHRIVATIGCKF